MFVDDNRSGIEADFITRTMNPHQMSRRGNYHQFTGSPQAAKGSGLDMFIQDMSEAQKNLSDRVDALESDLKNSKELEGLKGFWKKNGDKMKTTALIGIALYFAYTLFLKRKMAHGGGVAASAPAPQIGANDI
tara:strand:+ start:590 stop:988 length:399 start_codon:yes stop_codon:yes gene_type:complete